jgi:secondary thiamine-phosphate synthase enzyme
MRLTRTQIRLAPRPRGVHLITDEVVDAVDLSGARTGQLELFLQHTSAGLLLTENASPAVRRDLVRWFDEAVPYGWSRFEHDLEGPDDMPAHVASALFGASLSLPVEGGRLALGTWQGIALAELREHAGARRLTATLLAEEAG